MPPATAPRIGATNSSETCAGPLPVSRLSGTQQDALPARCAGYVLPLTESPEAAANRTRLAAAQAELTRLTGVVNTDTNQFQAAQDRAINECGGRATPETTGRAGAGPLCRSLQDHARALNAILQRDLDNLRRAQNENAVLTRTAARDQESALGAKTSSIDARVRDYRDSQHEPGLIDRFQALSELGSRSFQFSFIQWLIRILVVMVEAMPAFARVAIGRGTVDRIIDEEQNYQEQALHRSHEIAELLARMELKEAGLEAAAARRHEELMQQIRSARAQDAWVREFEKGVEELLATGPADEPPGSPRIA